MNYENMTVEELFNKVISWSHEYKNRNADDINFALTYIRDYLDEIDRRTLNEICVDNE